MVVGKKFYITVNFNKDSGSTITQEHKDLRGNPFFLKGKITGQILNNFTI